MCLNKKINNYVDVITYNNNYLLFNKINSCLLQFKKNELIIKDNDIYIKNISENDYEFLVNNDFFISNNDIKSKIKKYSEPTLSNHINITISVTEQCNLNCLYCYQTYWDKCICLPEKQYIHKILHYINFVLSIIKHNDIFLNINFIGGEPLLKKDLINDLTKKIINISKKSSKRVNLFFNIDTNLTLITKEFVNFFPNLSINTTLSLPYDHNKLRSNSFDKVLANILNLKTLFKKNNYNLTIRYNLHQHNINSFLEFIKLVHSLEIPCAIDVQNIANLGNENFYNNISTQDFEYIYVNSIIPILIKYGYEKQILPHVGLDRNCLGTNVLNCKFYSNGQRVLCDAIKKDKCLYFEHKFNTDPQILSLPQKCIQCYDYPYCGGVKPCYRYICNGHYKYKSQMHNRIKKYFEYHKQNIS